jgi:prepilin-type N-terminal cleavage/methylation domain-containing protein
MPKFLKPGPAGKNLRGRGGYSLIELLVVIVMIGILSGVIFASSRNSPKTLSLDRSAQKANQDISQARGMAMGGYLATCTVGGPVNGYGIFFSTASPSQYLVYANCDADNKYSASLDKQIGNSLSLESGVSVSSLKTGVSGTATTSISIFFLPPDPILYTNGTARVTSSVVLSVSGLSQTKTLNVSGSGIVNVK